MTSSNVIIINRFELDYVQINCEQKEEMMRKSKASANAEGQSKLPNSSMTNV